MSHYRKVDVRIWNDERFRELSDDGKLVFLKLLTHPNMTSLGAMRASPAGLADDLCWGAERLAAALGESLALGMVELDRRGPLVALPNFLKYNAPESPNVLRSWVRSLDLLPACALKTLTLHRVKAFAEGLSEGFQRAFTEAFADALEKASAKPLAKPCPNHEHEQQPSPTSLQEGASTGTEVTGGPKLRAVGGGQ